MSVAPAASPGDWLAPSSRGRERTPGGGCVLVLRRRDHGRAGRVHRRRDEGNWVRECHKSHADLGSVGAWRRSSVPAGEICRTRSARPRPRWPTSLGRRDRTVRARRRPHADGQDDRTRDPRCVGVGRAGPCHSVKTDLLRDTIDARRARGVVQLFDPGGETALESVSWSPPRRLQGLGDRPSDRQVAVGGSVGPDARTSPTRTSGTPPRRNSSHPSSSPLRAGAPRWPTSSLDRHPSGSAVILKSSTRPAHESRRRLPSLVDARRAPRSKIYTTAETILAAYADPRVLDSSVHEDITAADTPRRRTSNTLYLARTRPRTTPPPTALRNPHPGNRRSHLRTRRPNRQTTRPAAAARPRRMRQHRAAPRPRQPSPRPAPAKASNSSPSSKTSPRSNRYGRDRAATIVSQPPRQSHPLRHRRTHDARVALPPPRRRGSRPAVARRPVTVGDPRRAPSLSAMAPANLIRQGRPGTAVLVHGNLRPASIRLRPVVP